ncbi:hypothetical protein DFJ74DRAFT_142787 [Hyaloraphidium curvatum]|nr:hypothetical protein DFJ74DRAFT_142787 [Hyaloraphidium curvatum]
MSPTRAPPLLSPRSMTKRQWTCRSRYPARKKSLRTAWMCRRPNRRRDPRKGLRQRAISAGDQSGDTAPQPFPAMRAAAFSVAAIALALAVVASGSPVRAAQAPAVFRRSCAACAEHEYCELGYPGAPLDAVACVDYSSASRRALYRRYAPGSCSVLDPPLYPSGMLQCGTGGGYQSACDLATGALVPSGTADGMCVNPDADEYCCQSVATGCANAGGGAKQMCRAAVGAASNVVYASTSQLQCDLSTGVVGSGSGRCSSTPAVGSAAGCCVPT